MSRIGLRLTKRQRELIATATDKCGDVPLGVAVPVLACQLPYGHRGNHAAEVITPYARMCGKWPQKKAKRK
jgi:hypothetical protein